MKSEALKRMSTPALAAMLGAGQMVSRVVFDEMAHMESRMKDLKAAQDELSARIAAQRAADMARALPRLEAAEAKRARRRARNAARMADGK